MRAFQFIAEAKGMFGRRLGDPYINDNGVKVTFKQAEMYPDTKPGNAYKDHAETLKAIGEIQRKTGKEITWVNRESPTTNAFAIVFLNSEDGNIIMWGRWYKTVPTNVVGSWSNNELPQGWVFSSKTSEKEKSGMTPQDLIATDNTFESADDLLNKIQSNGASSEIMEGLRMVAGGQKDAVFAGLGDKLTSVRDHLGEIISPLALISGVINDSNSTNAANDILKTSYSNCNFWFPQNKNNSLIDSEFIAPNGERLGISTKGDKGATASVRNIYDVMVSDKNKKLAKKYSSAVKVLSTMVTSGQKMSPLNLGVELGVIDEKLKNEILKHIDSKVNKPENMSRAAKKLFVAYGSKEDSPGYNIGYVLLANCAKSVAEKLNNDADFQKALQAFLNQASIIQVYTDAKVVSGDVKITGFKTVYPPKFTGKALIKASKTYLSTGIKGNFTFDIGKGAV